MTPAPARRTTCARCGAAFDCAPGGPCWCAAEPYRMPLPDPAAAAAAAHCLCPSCLRAAASAMHEGSRSASC